jgi:hypothetical protein
MAVTGAPSITEIYSKTVILGAAELLAFAGGAIQVVPPPGAGKVIWPISSMLIYDFGTFDFLGTPTFNLTPHGAGLSLWGSGISGLTGQGASSYAFGTTAIATLGTNLVAPSINQGLDLVLTSGSFALGGISAASVTAGGTGYAIGDTGTITTGNGDATYRVLTVSGLGAVLTFAITFPGSGYATGAGQATATGGAQPGVGVNFTVDVTAINNGDGTIKVTTLYQVIDVP